MKIVYMEQQDLFSAPAIEVLSTHAHMGYIKYNLLPQPQDKVMRFGIADIWEDDDYMDVTQAVYKVLTTDRAANTLFKLNMCLHWEEVGPSEIDDFMLTNQGNSIALQREMLNIAIEDEQSEHLVEYVWSFYAVPTTEKDFAKWTVSACRDMYPQVHKCLMQAKQQFIDAQSKSILSWLRGMGSDKKEIIDFLQYLDPKLSYGVLTHLSHTDLRATLVKIFAEHAFDTNMIALNKKVKDY